MKTYLLTFKTLKEQYPIAQMYMDALALVLNAGKQLVMTKNAFEADQDNKLHFHAIVMANYIRFKDISDILFANDMYFNFKELKTVDDVKRATSYLNKCSINPYLHEQKYWTHVDFIDETDTLILHDA